MKSIQIPSFFWSVFSCIWTECRKIQTRQNSVFGHFSRSVHRVNETRDQTYTAMTDVDPNGLENAKPILKKKKAKDAFSSVGTHWVFSMDGHDKLNGFPKNTFPLAVYRCIDRAIQKPMLVGIWTHRIDTQNHSDLPNGNPDHIYVFPSEYGLHACCKESLFLYVHAS